MVLLYLMEHWVKLNGGQIIVAHVNHELRQQSDQEQSFLEQYCQRHQLQLIVTHWPKSQHPTYGIETAAREFRYAFFEQVINQFQADGLMTAHHQNDQAETFLMKLTRGGQLGQLLGIRWQRRFHDAWLWRPLLNLSKAQLTNFAKSHQIRWFEDVTNQDLSISRNRFRHRIVPALEAENERFLEHLTDYQNQLSDIITVANEAVDHVVSGQSVLKIEQLEKHSMAWQQLALQRWLERVHQVTNLTRHQLEQIHQLVMNSQKPQAIYDLGDQRLLQKQYGCLSVVTEQIVQSRNHDVLPDVSVLKLNHWYNWGGESLIGVFADAYYHDMQIEKIGDSQVDLWIAPTDFPLALRKWHPGDQIRIKGGHHQSVSRVLINQKVDRGDRAEQSVIVDQQDNILWITGRKAAWLERPADFKSQWRRVWLVMRATK